MRIVITKENIFTEEIVIFVHITLLRRELYCLKYASDVFGQANNTGVLRTMAGLANPLMHNVLQSGHTSAEKNQLVLLLKRVTIL